MRSVGTSFVDDPPLWWRVRVVACLVLVGVWASLSGTLGAAHITNAEYFIGEDPGVGEGTTIEPWDNAYDYPDESVSLWTFLWLI